VSNSGGCSSAGGDSSCGGVVLGGGRGVSSGALGLRGGSVSGCRLDESARLLSSGGSSRGGGRLGCGRSRGALSCGSSG